MSNNLRREQINEAVDVSGAFDNCFFHTYAAHLLANGLPLPEDLFTFKSILGKDSAASHIQQRFPNIDSLSVFAQYHKLKSPKQKPLSPQFVVEKTLVMGFLLREWFATQMEKNDDIKTAMQGVVIPSFKQYIDFRNYGVNKNDLLSDPEGVLYQANEAFLEYFFVRPKEGTLTAAEQRFEQYFTVASEDHDEALKAYWDKEGYQNYCRELAKPNTKLSYQEIVPVIDQSITIYDTSGTIIYEKNIHSQTQKLKVTLDPLAGHYHLLKTKSTTTLLEKYEKSYRQYKKDREEVLATIGDKDTSAEAKRSLLVASICPKGHLSDDPFKSLLNKVDEMTRFIQSAKRLELEKQPQPEVEPPKPVKASGKQSEEQNRLPNKNSSSLKHPLPNDKFFKQQSEQIDRILEKFKQKIDAIEGPSSDAKAAAIKLTREFINPQTGGI